MGEQRIRPNVAKACTVSRRDRGCSKKYCFETRHVKNASVRAVPLILSILLGSHFLLAAPKVSDSGVPAGWSALQYDNFGNGSPQQTSVRPIAEIFRRRDPNRAEPMDCLLQSGGCVSHGTE